MFRKTRLADRSATEYRSSTISFTVHLRCGAPKLHGGHRDAEGHGAPTGIQPQMNAESRGSTRMIQFVLSASTCVHLRFLCSILRGPPCLRVLRVTSASALRA